MKKNKKLSLYSLVLSAILLLSPNMTAFANNGETPKAADFVANEVLTYEEYLEQVDSQKDFEYFESSGPIQPQESMVAPNSSYIGYYESGGFRYDIKSYTPTGRSVDKFKYYLGGCTFVNSYKNPVTAVYTQSTTVTHTASLSVGAKASLTVKTKVIEFAGEISAGVSLSHTTTQGTTISATVTIDPGDSVDITAYMRGINVTGTLLTDVYYPPMFAYVSYDHPISTNDWLVDPTWRTVVIN